VNIAKQGEAAPSILTLPKTANNLKPSPAWPGRRRRRRRTQPPSRRSSPCRPKGADWNASRHSAAAANDSEQRGREQPKRNPKAVRHWLSIRLAIRQRTSVLEPWPTPSRLAVGIAGGTFHRSETGSESSVYNSQHLRECEASSWDRPACIGSMRGSVPSGRPEPRTNGARFVSRWQKPGHDGRPRIAPELEAKILAALKAPGRGR